MINNTIASILIIHFPDKNLLTCAPICAPIKAPSAAGKNKLRS